MKKETLIDLLKVLGRITVSGIATDPEFKKQALQVIAIVDEIQAALNDGNDTTNTADQ